MKKTVYRVKDWNKHFEISQSRKCNRMAWVAIPNKHDGKGYRRIMRHERSADIYAAWILILQVASKCEPRGVLIDDDGPLDAEDLSDATGLEDVGAFVLALDVLVEPRIGWLEKVEIEDPAPIQLPVSYQLRG